MKVIVGGCSVSDYSGADVERVYGEILAEKIGADYIHHGAGCGSNYRIWRVITKMVMNNEIDKDDIVLIQYTNVNRQEFWSSHVPLNGDGDPAIWYRFDERKKIETREQKYNGDIIRFKTNLSMPDKNEQKFFDLKQTYFTSIGFDEERFEYNHFLFHSLMISKNIKVAYFVPDSGEGAGMAGYSLDNIHLFNKNGEIHITDGLTFQYPGAHLRDPGHFNQRGHEYVAKVLEKFIKKKQWI